MNEYFRNQKLEGVWILKPANESCGVGIEMIDDIKKFQEIMNEEEKYNREYVIQKYIENPLLIENKKFDIRCYAMVVSTDPYILLFKHGYVRRALETYKVDSEDRFVHLVNHEV